MFFHNGELYILEYGTGWYNVKNGRLLKVSYSTDFNQAEAKGDDPRFAGMDLKHQGTKYLQKAVCMSCHTSQTKILGPTFAEIAQKYKGDKNAIKSLALKVKNGGTGVWGNQPMPAHNMYKDEQITEMVKAILQTKKVDSGHKK